MQRITECTDRQSAPRNPKRIKCLAAIFVVALACALAVPALLAAAKPLEGTVTQDGATYTYSIEEGEAAITHIAKAEDNPSETYEAVIPESITVDGRSYLVVALADNVMGTKYEKSSTSAPDTVVSDSALTRVVLPSKLLSVGNQAFAECLVLETVEFATDEDGQQHLQSVGDYAFYQAAATNLQLPDTLTKVGKYAFAYMQKLQTVKLPATRTEWGFSPFNQSVNMREFVIPEGTVTVPKVSYAGAAIDIPSTIEGEVNISASNASEVSVSPEANINALTLQFARCERLEIPQSVTELGLSGECPQVVFPGNLKVITLYDVFGNENVVIPASVETIGRSSFIGNESMKTLSFEAGSKLREIGLNAFYSCPNLECIELPEGLVSLDMTAFKDCTALKELNVPSSVSEVKNYVEGCSALESISFANGSLIPSIQRVARDCAELKKITLPDSMQSVIRGSGSYLATGCPKLEQVIVCNPDLQLQESDFDGCGNFKVYGWGTEGNVLDFAESSGHEFVPFAELDNTGKNAVSNVKISAKNGEKPQVVAQFSSVKGYNYSRLLIEGSDYAATQVQQNGITYWQVQGNNQTAFGTALVAASKSIADASIAPIAAQLYSGTPCQPKPVVTLGGHTLAEGTDYVLSYANNAQPGTATVTATGTGAYTGGVSATFTVAAALTVTQADRTAAASVAVPEQAETVVVAWAWDAVAVASASSFSATTGYPLVAVSNTGLTTNQVAQLGAWGTKTAYVVGGLGSCGQATVQQLQQAGVECRQVAGASAAETSLALAGCTQAWGNVAVVANPEYPALAVAAGAFAGTAGAPLVYTNPDGTLGAQTLQVLQSFSQVIIAGDQFQVDAAAQAALGQAVRVSGNGDAATSLALASYAQKAGWYQVGPLYATSVADAPTQAAWAAIAGKTKAPFTLVDLGNCEPVATWAQANAQTVQGYMLLQREAEALDSLANMLQTAN